MLRILSVAGTVGASLAFLGLREKLPSVISQQSRIWWVGREIF